MKRIVTIILTGLIVTQFAMAQTIEDGMKMLDYDKHQSAAAIFKKLYDADSKNPENV